MGIAQCHEIARAAPRTLARFSCPGMFITTVLITILGTASTPGAAPPPSTATSPTETTPPMPTETVVVKRYGLQILAVDALGLGITVATRQPALLGLVALGGPAVHVVHGNIGKALGSAALRAGLVTLGALAGAAATDCEDTSNDDFFCGAGEILIGGAVGGVVAIAIDVSLLAVKTRRVPSRPTAVPTVAASRDGFSVGLAGQF